MLFEDAAARQAMDRVLLMPAPREIPPDLRKRVGSLKGSWSTIVFGLLFGSFGMFFCVVFLPWELPREWRLDQSGPRRVPGRVVAVEKTNLSINDVSVRRFEVEFEDGGVKRRSVGHITGGGPEVGAEVAVRVHPEDPELNCPEGMRIPKGTLFSGFVLIFPLAGYGIVVVPFLARWRRLRLLRHGTVVKAKVLKAEPTRTEVNGQAVHKFELSFPGRPGVVKVRKSQPQEVGALMTAYADEEAVRLVHHPGRPRRFTVVDGWL